MRIVSRFGSGRCFTPSRKKNPPRESALCLRLKSLCEAESLQKIVVDEQVLGLIVLDPIRAIGHHFHTADQGLQCHQCRVGH